MEHITGTFDVKTLPQNADNKEAETAGVGRMSLDKQFHGELEATSTGEMLYIGEQEAQAYVALERVKGTLRGKSGGFVLYHVGTMTSAETTLTVKILNDSGTGDLKGISGTMTIRLESGRHFYDLDYSIPLGT